MQRELGLGVTYHSAVASFLCPKETTASFLYAHFDGDQVTLCNARLCVLFVYLLGLAGRESQPQRRRRMTDFYEDACYLSNSEAEPDSETEECSSSSGVGASKPDVVQHDPASAAWEDPQALLNTWLGELDNLQAVSPNTILSFFFFPLFCRMGAFGTTNEYLSPVKPRRHCVTRPVANGNSTGWSAGGGHFRFLSFSAVSRRTCELMSTRLIRFAWPVEARGRGCYGRVLLSARL